MKMSRVGAPTRATKSVIAIAAAIGIAHSSGCADLSRVAPQLRVTATALRRTAVNERPDGASASQEWSYAVGASLAGGIPEPVLEPVISGGGSVLEVGPSAACRVPSLCIWEARERARALRRAEAILALRRVR